MAESVDTILTHLASTIGRKSKAAAGIASRRPKIGPERVTFDTFPTDGTAEGNGQALASAITAVASSGGTVVMPNRKVAITPPGDESKLHTYILPAGVAIAGEGPASEILFQTAEIEVWELFTFKNGHNAIENLRITKGALAKGTVFTILRGSGYYFSGLTIDSKEAEFPGASFQMMEFRPVTVSDKISGVTLRRSKIVNGRYGIVEYSEMQGDVSDVVVEGCAFRANWEDDLEFNAPAGTGSNILISHCGFYDNKAAGTQSGFGVGVANYQHVSVEDCAFEGYAMNPVHIEDRSADVTITRCRFRNFGLRDTSFQSAIVLLSSTADVTVTDCEIDTTSQATSAYGVVAGPGGAGFSDPYRIMVMGNKMTAANGSEFLMDLTATSEVLAIANSVTTPPAAPTNEAIWSAGFESDVDGFGSWQNVVVSRITSQQRTGAGALQLAFAAATPQQAAGPAIPVIGGTSYVLTAWVNAPAGSHIKFYGTCESDAGWVSNEGDTNEFTMLGSYQQVQLKFKAPAAATKIYPLVSPSGASAGKALTVIVDDASLRVDS